MQTRIDIRKGNGTDHSYHGTLGTFKSQKATREARQAWYDARIAEKAIRGLTVAQADAESDLWLDEYPIDTNGRRDD